MPRHVAHWVDSLKKCAPVSALLQEFWKHTEAEERHGQLLSATTKDVTMKGPELASFQTIKSNLETWRNELRPKATVPLEEAAAIMLSRFAQTCPTDDLTDQDVAMVDAALSMASILHYGIDTEAAKKKLQGILARSSSKATRAKLLTSLGEDVSLESMSQISHLTSTLAKDNGEQRGISAEDAELHDAIKDWLGGFQKHLVQSVKGGSLSSAVIEAAAHAKATTTDAMMAFTPVAGQPALKSSSDAVEKVLRHGLVVQDALQSLKDMSPTEALCGQLRILHNLHTAVHVHRQAKADAEKGDVEDFWLALEVTVPAACAC